MIRTIVQSVRTYTKTDGVKYLVTCKALDPPKRQYKCYVPEHVYLPHAGDYIEIYRAGKDNKLWIYWS